MARLPDDVRRALAAAAHSPILLVAADFDGTISPIVAHPCDARPIPSAIEALTELAGLPHTASALISGRALTDLKALSGAPAVVNLVGSHGSEFVEGVFEGVDNAAQVRLGRLIAALESVSSRYPGSTVETKPISVAFHVRNVDPENARQALDDALAAADDFDVHLTEGKAVREFALIRTDKGEALDLLRHRVNATAVIYFGDDVTDEWAFRRLVREGSDVGVKVGPGDTMAAFRVDSPDDVAEALRFVVESRGR